MKGFTIVPRIRGKCDMINQMRNDCVNNIIKYSDATDYLATIIMTVDIESRFKQIRDSQFHHREIIGLYYSLKRIFEIHHEPIFTWLCVAYRLKLDKNITRMISKRIVK